MENDARRTALVTGAALGIGRAIADRFSADGWHVYRFDVADAEGTGCVLGDVRSANDWNALAARIEGEVGRLDVLVNNAGIIRERRLDDLTIEDWNDLLAVNLTGTFLGCKTMLPLLRKGKSPAILNMG